MTTLTLEHANLVAEGAIRHAADQGLRISVSICDPGGRLLAFQRMDGGHWAAGYGSQGKAVASAAFARPSGVVAELAHVPIMPAIAEAEGGHIIYCQGAVPIFVDGVQVGAVGVGGGSAQQDEDCAVAGVSHLAQKGPASASISRD
ncbi:MULTISPECIES: GlcG/HbpS family heme-binding protein [Aeromicrobium]|uniref:GlcG/HbpS family heme-binding protein n=1 Tax=Aeromicrobium TaxID=2040 RepID=UPI00257B0FE0|nr:MULTISPECIES: heme-binding protein [Aeromicrobium]